MLKKFQKVILAVLILICFSNLANAQKLYFCTGSDDEGNPVSKNTVFNMGIMSSIFINLLVQFKEETECKEVLFNIYKLSSSGEEKYVWGMYRKVKPNLLWAEGGYTFNETGVYKVYCKDCNKKTIITGKFMIKKD